MAYATTFERTIANGGGTFDPESMSDVTYGYSTGAIDGTYATVTVEHDNMDNTRHWYGRAINMLMGDMLIDRFPSNTKIGTWVNDGVIHIDPAIVFDNEDECAAYARSHAQLAYYVIHEQREVML